MATHTFVTELPEGSAFNRFARWKRTSVYDDEAHEVYLPAGMFMDEKTALLCVGCDGVGAVWVRKHLYVPARWLVRQLQKKRAAELADTAEIMRNRFRAYLAAEPPPEVPT